MRYHRVLFIATAASAALACAAGTARAQNLPPDQVASSRSLDTIENVPEIEPERPREFASYSLRREGTQSLFTAGDLRLGHRRDRDESGDGRRTRFEQIYLSDDEQSFVRWALWRSGDRQDFHGGAKYKASGIDLSIAF